MRSAILYLLTILWVAVMTLPAAGAQNQITFWTIEMEKERLEIQREIAHAFTKKTGIDVRVVPVRENLLAERVTAASAGGSLPDVLFHPIDFTIGWAEAGILDDQSATDVVNHLGKETFDSKVRQ
ncbi:MAG: extracellular solute-binding protein [Desulfobulbaceae bacterium]|nr:extracellular solute-binding protein [Desulfobulbaceae bacterium]